MRVELQKHRNQLIHGNDGEISVFQLETTWKLVDYLHSELKPLENIDNRWLFDNPIEDRVREPYSKQIAWLDGIKPLFPDEYAEAISRRVSEDSLTTELEYVKNQRNSVLL